MLIYFIAKVGIHIGYIKMKGSFDNDIFGELVEPTAVPNCDQKYQRTNASKRILVKQEEFSHQQISQTFSQPRSHLQRLQKMCTETETIREGSRRSQGEKQLSSISTAVQESYKQIPLIAKPIRPDDLFDCIVCQHEKLPNLCIICGGSGKVRGDSNMVKFIDYLIEFKLGLRSSYKNDIKLHQSAKFNQRSKEELQKSQKLQKKITHEGIICDGCGVTPIVGSRYHCNHRDCKNDYDLCFECFMRIDHKHNLEEIRETEVRKTLRRYECQLSNAKASSFRFFPTCYY